MNNEIEAAARKLEALGASFGRRSAEANHDDIRRCTEEITSIIIDGFRSEESLLAPISELQQLTEAGIVNSIISAPTFERLSKLKNLRYLSLYGSTFTLPDLESLATSSIRKLVLTDTKLSVTEKKMAREQFPYCEVFQ